MHVDELSPASPTHDEICGSPTTKQVDADDAPLLEALGCVLRATRLWLRREGAIGADGCAALRRVVDADRDVSRDSVDQQAQHQLNLPAEKLVELIGAEPVSARW